MKLFDDSLPFFKGNLHAHTTDSDGRLEPAAVKALYKSKGYDFLALTDHWRANRPDCLEGMLVLSGIELDCSLPETVHIVGVGVEPSRFEDGWRECAPQQLIDEVNAAGGRAILAHPAWSLNGVAMIQSLRGVVATEVYNTFSGAPWNAERADSSGILDLAATQGTLINLVASDDAHFYTGEAGLSYTRVQAAALERDAILDALDNGRFYASQGPEIRQISYDGEEIVVESSPVETAIFYSNLPWVHGRCRTGKAMTRQTYGVDRERGETYVRCELIDAFGRRAWTNPIDVRAK